MLSRTSVLGILLVFAVVLMRESGCHSYQMRGSYPLNDDYQERQIFRRAHLKDDDDSSRFSKKDSDIFGSNSEESSNQGQLQEENDSWAQLDEPSVLDITMGHSSQMVKRRKGPTLSVVNPLEILRQRLMLDLARRRIHENQRQIVANAQLLENIGKRSSAPVFRRPDAYHDGGSLGDNNYQP